MYVDAIIKQVHGKPSKLIFALRITRQKEFMRAASVFTYDTAQFHAPPLNLREPRHIGRPVQNCHIPSE